MLHDVKRLFGRLLWKWWSARQPLISPPAFDEGAVFASLKAPQEAAQAWRDGKTDAAWETLIEHFRGRETPLGFIVPAHVPGLLAEAARRFPDWRERLLAKVEEDRRQGLRTYDRRAAPLTGAFDWSVEAAGPLDDRLYGARPHRFGFLARWALACHYDRGLIPELAAVLEGWVAAASLPGGHPGFKSSHVVIYHFIAVLLAWPFLAALDAGKEGAALTAVLRRLLLILYEDSRNLVAVAGSGVANNHLLAERFAVWLTAALLPEFDHSGGRGVAEAVWIEELLRQTYEDGGCFEHSVHYQEHDCEMAVAYLLLSRRNGWRVPAPVLARIERMLDFQLTLAGPALLPSAFGNTTEDPLLALGVGEAWQCGLLHEVQRAAFGSQARAVPDDDPTRETAFWLLEGELAEGSAGAEAELPFRDFPDSGFCVLAAPEAGARLIFRLGPSPGAAAIGGHSHGDLLSLCLSIGDTQVLAPPGTGTYRFKPHPELPGQPNLRAYFASAACRSGFFIDGEEPYGPHKGDFRNWRLPCRVEARRASSSAAGLTWIEGRVVGEGAYAGQRRGVVHVWEDAWLVYDRPPPLGPQQRGFIGWQFGPAATCRLQDDGKVEACSAGGDTRLALRAVGTGEATVVTGGLDPFRGWVSPSYGVWRPAPNLRFALPAETKGAAFLLTLDPPAGQRFEQVVDSAEALGFRVTSPGAETTLLLAVDDTGAAVQWEDLVFQGRLLCLQRGADGLRLRALGLTRLTAPSLKLEVSAAEAADVELLLVGGEVHWPRGACPAVTVKVDHDRV